ncbi:MAG: NYN domain-containing protein [Lachnospirales bacterium]
MKKEYLLVDGYNIIFAWDELRKLSEQSIDAARDRLINMLCNYQGVKKMELILVFDAYKVSGGTGSITKEGNIYVVYTKEAETADAYIERTTHELRKNHYVKVATSDGLEQVIIMSSGALRMSARDLYEDVKSINRGITEFIHTSKPVKNNMLVDNLDDETADFLDKLRYKK